MPCYYNFGLWSSRFEVYGPGNWLLGSKIAAFSSAFWSEIATMAVSEIGCLAGSAQPPEFTLIACRSIGTSGNAIRPGLANR